MQAAARVRPSLSGLQTRLWMGAHAEAHEKEDGGWQKTGGLLTLLEQILKRKQSVFPTFKVTSAHFTNFGTSKKIDKGENHPSSQQQTKLARKLPPASQVHAWTSEG